MKRTLLLIALSAILTACSALADSQLSRARSRWRSAHISHYSYKLSVGCFCAFTERMPLTVEVQDGRVISMSYRDGSAVSSQDQQIFADYQTIDALFDFTSQSIHKADNIKVQYDPTYGFPSSVQIDFIRNAADDELSLSVSDFQRLP